MRFAMLFVVFCGCRPLMANGAVYIGSPQQHEKWERCAQISRDFGLVVDRVPVSTRPGLIFGDALGVTISGKHVILSEQSDCKTFIHEMLHVLYPKMKHEEIYRFVEAVDS